MTYISPRVEPRKTMLMAEALPTNCRRSKVKCTSFIGCTNGSSKPKILTAALKVICLVPRAAAIWLYAVCSAVIVVCVVVLIWLLFVAFFTPVMVVCVCVFFVRERR